MLQAVSCCAAASLLGCRCGRSHGAHETASHGLPACTTVPPWGFAGSSWESALFDTSLGRARAASLRDAAGAHETVRGPWRRLRRALEAWFLAL